MSDKTSREKSEVKKAKKEMVAGKIKKESIA